MASPAYADPHGPLRLAVLADSTAFTGPHGPLLPDDASLYPNVAAAALADAIGRRVTVTTLAHPGAGVRESLYAVTKDRHVMFEVLQRSDAVIVGIGSFDHAPAGVPTWIEALVPFVRPAWIRRRVRGALRAAHPLGVRAVRGSVARVPAGEFAKRFDQVLFHVRALSYGAPGVVLGPTSHRSPYYGHVHPSHPARERMQREIATGHGFGVVDTWPLVVPWLEKLNPDGIHWPFEVHEAVGREAAATLAAQILGRVAAPGVPWPPGMEPA